MTALVTELSGLVGIDRACAALDLSHSTYYRRRRPAAPKAPKPRPTPARALASDQRQVVLDMLHSERFVDQAPAAVVATLFEEGVYHCSARTMYRILASQLEVRERRNQLRHPKYARPELVDRIRSGDGTSRSCVRSRSGRTTTSTYCSTSSAATLVSGRR